MKVAAIVIIIAMFAMFLGIAVDVFGKLAGLW